MSFATKACQDRKVVISAPALTASATGSPVVKWQVFTWEHEALRSKSFGRANRVQECERLLPAQMTAAIYDALVEREKAFLRLSEPLPPFQARLLRNIEGYKTICKSSEIFAKRFVDVVPDWEAKVAEALGPRLNSVTGEIGNLASPPDIPKVPKNGSSVGYYYRIDVLLISGRQAGVKKDSSLLMDCEKCIPFLPPGQLRDVFDAIMRC